MTYGRLPAAFTKTKDTENYNKQRKNVLFPVDGNVLSIPNSILWLLFFFSKFFNTSETVHEPWPVDITNNEYTI